MKTTAYETGPLIYSCSSRCTSRNESRVSGCHIIVWLQKPLGTCTLLATSLLTNNLASHYNQW